MQSFAAASWRAYLDDVAASMVADLSEEQLAAWLLYLIEAVEANHLSTLSDYDFDATLIMLREGIQNRLVDDRW